MSTEVTTRNAVELPAFMQGASSLPAAILNGEVTAVTNSGEAVSGGLDTLKLGSRGKWEVRIGGETIEIPGGGRDTIDVTIVAALPKFHRIFYGSTYVPGEKATPPKCTSEDGEVPHPSVKNPINDKCRTCPMSQSGSAVDGKSKACGSYKRIVVIVPALAEIAPEFATTPLVYNFNPSSCFRPVDSDKKAQGWYNFRDALDVMATIQKSYPDVNIDLSMMDLTLVDDDAAETGTLTRIRINGYLTPESDAYKLQQATVATKKDDIDRYLDMTLQNQAAPDAADVPKGAQESNVDSVLTGIEANTAAQAPASEAPAQEAPPQATSSAPDEVASVLADLKSTQG